MKWNLEKHGAKTEFRGKFGEKEVNLQSFGFYKIENRTHLLQIETEVDLLTEMGLEYFKGSAEGQLQSTSDPAGVKVFTFSSCFIENFAMIDMQKMARHV